MKKKKEDEEDEAELVRGPESFYRQDEPAGAR